MSLFNVVLTGCLLLFVTFAIIGLRMRSLRDPFRERLSKRQCSKACHSCQTAPQKRVLFGSSVNVEKS